MSRSAPKAVLAVALPAALLAAGGCGGESDSAEPDRFGAIPKRTIQAPDDETAPRWQQIGVLRSSDAAPTSVNVSPGALQWRVRWRCGAGSIAIAVTPPPPSSNGRAAGECPGRGSRIWVGTGTYRVAARSSAEHRVVVEEEVRTPLHEDPPAAVRAGEARRIARGRIRPIEAKGRGNAILYRLPDDRLLLRMQGFATEPNPDLEVWLSESDDPTTSRNIFRADHTMVRSLKSTIGDQNYVLPATAQARRIRSLVVVNESQRIAYAAARLTR
ncbi:MAG: DM13 domain-containing protein [Thermoleophilia bacterium]